MYIYLLNAMHIQRNEHVDLHLLPINCTLVGNHTFIFKLYILYIAI
jgi:hypothetical protein